ncbi:phosphotransferase [Hansschlegelia sp.]|uniref:phosphotransferase n=1 Tax=Hansschlegelia sp. TaxID=2041892 RepID=UPI002C4F5C25|nr:phosphotransferase [Hansschlegelia sp.]HVI29844.1 phosphotransferase [Hansschlegelia sp.]
MRIVAQDEVRGVIGRGRIATVYELPDGRALKAYPSRIKPAFVEREYAVTRAVRDAGGPAWRVDEMVACFGGLGIVGERVVGETLGARARRSLTEAVRVAAALAEANVRVARTPLLDAALVERRWRRETYLKMGTYGARVMADIGLCHGDLNLNNVIVRPDGALVVLDWALAFRGPVVADMCRSNRSLRKTLLRGETGRLAGGAKRAVALWHQILVCRRMRWPMLKL